MTTKGKKIELDTLDALSFTCFSKTAISLLNDER